MYTRSTAAAVIVFVFHYLKRRRKKQKNYAERSVSLSRELYA